MGASLSATMGSSFKRRASSGVIGAQTMPEVWRTMKAICSGVILDGGGDQIALVLPVVVVDHHDHLAPGDGVDGVLNGVEGWARRLACGGILEIFGAHGAVGQRADFERQVERGGLAGGELRNPRCCDAQRGCEVLLLGAGGFEPVLEFHGKSLVQLTVHHNIDSTVLNLRKLTNSCMHNPEMRKKGDHDHVCARAVSTQHWALSGPGTRSACYGDTPWARMHRDDFNRRVQSA